MIVFKSDLLSELVWVTTGKEQFRVGFYGSVGLTVEAYGFAVAVGQPSFDDIFYPAEGTHANKQDVCCVNRDKRLFGVLTPALWHDTHNAALDNFQQALLYALARHIPDNGHAITFFCQLVDFVEADNSHLGTFHVVVAFLKKTHEYVFHVLAHIPCLGKLGTVVDMARYTKHLGDILDEERLACAGVAEHQHVRFVNFNVCVGTVVP